MPQERKALLNSSSDTQGPGDVLPKEMGRTGQL